MDNTDETFRRNRNRSWWKQRTRMEKTSVILLILAAVIIIALIIGIAVAAHKAKSKSGNNSVCLTPGCVQAATAVLKNIDRSVNPCDDFYEFACGRYIKETVLPEDKTSLDIRLVLNDILKQQLRTLLEKPVKPKEPKPFVLAKKYYNICSNISAIETDGLNTVKRIFRQVGGWPVMEGSSWNDNGFDWKTLTYKLRQHGLPFKQFINVDTTYDAQNSSLRIILLDQPQLDLGRDNILRGFEDSLIKSYYEYMIEMAELFGADRTTAKNDVRSMISFKIELTKITLPEKDLLASVTLYNPMTVAQLQGKYKSIPWLEFISNIINSPDVKVSSTEMLNIKAADYLTRLEELLQRTRKRDQANYVFFQIIRGLTLYLPESMLNRELQFLGTFLTLPKRAPRWSDCIDQVSLRFKDALGALYVRKYFQEDSKKVVVEMISDIRKELINNIKKVNWMDEDTRKTAIEKALSITTHVGYPSELMDDKKLEELYSKLNFSSANYLTVNNQLILFETNADLGQIHDPINKTDWRMRQSTVTINAGYLAQENSIQILAGILQSPYYEKDRPQYMNYGGMGYVIGHELTHGFDNLGKQFDKNGDFVNWWAEKTDNAYKEKAQCIIKQYGDIVVPEIGKNLDGVKTQGETIADNGGIKEAYLAYDSWVERNGPEPMLPGLNYTVKQLFWIASAHCWCAKVTKQSLEDDIEDEHPPSHYRITVPFSNTKYFAKDFNCPVGSKMNPKHKCEVW